MAETIVPYEDAMKPPAPETVSYEDAMAPPGALAAYGSDVLKVPGDVVGMPRTVLHDLPSYMPKRTEPPEFAPARKAFSAAFDALPSSEDFNNAIGLAPHLVDHTSTFGKITGAALQSMLTLSPRSFFKALAEHSAAAGAADAGKAALAGGAAATANEVDPGNLPLQMGAAAVAHSAPGLVSNVVKAGYPAIRPLIAPSATGIDAAANVGAQVDNSPTAAPAQPSALDLMNAQRQTQNNVWSMGPGVDAPVAGTDIKNDLLSRQADLVKARSDLVQPFAEARDASTTPIDIKPVLSVINDKLGTAAGVQRVALIKARNSLDLPNADGAPNWVPRLRSQADELAASRQAISSQIDAAKNGTSPDNVTATHLMDVRDALDKQIESMVPDAKTAKDLYAAASRPLDPFSKDKNTVSAVPDVVERNQYGEPVVGTPNSEIPDSFLTGNATKEKLDQLLAAHGGNKAAAFSSLNDFLIGKMQNAVKVDGTLDSAAFDKVMAPYKEALDGNASMHFPDLRKKFGDVKAAQATLDKVTGQNEINASLAGDPTTGTPGGLRDTSTKGGVVTRASVQGWLNKNADKIAATQSPATVMRWKQIANAMPDDPLAFGHKVLEAAPAAAAIALGGGEAGLVSAVTGGKLVKMARSVPDARLMEAYSKTIESIFRDPAEATRLSQELASRKGGLSASAKFRDAFKRNLSDAAKATVPAVSAVH